MPQSGANMEPTGASPPAAPATLPDNDDLLEEILIRLSKEPSALPCASLVCKRWHRLVSEPRFLRRFRAHRRNLPVLGVFDIDAGEAEFTSALDPPVWIDEEQLSLQIVDTEHESWSLLGCRHGLVLLLDIGCRLVIVYDPIAYTQRRIPAPPDFVQDRRKEVNGAVVRTAAGHFKVVLVSTRGHNNGPAVARVYSSKTRRWGDLVSTADPCATFLRQCSAATLVGDALYWMLWGRDMLEFDLPTQTLAFVEGSLDVRDRRSQIIRTQDGGLGLVESQHMAGHIWERELDGHGWRVTRTFDLCHVLGLEPSMSDDKAIIVGYSEEADAILYRVDTTVFVVQLDDSMHSKPLPYEYLDNSYHPFTDFYTFPDDVYLDIRYHPLY